MTEEMSVETMNFSALLNGLASGEPLHPLIHFQKRRVVRPNHCVNPKNSVALQCEIRRNTSSLGNERTKLLLDNTRIDRLEQLRLRDSQRLAELVHLDDERNVFTLTAQMDHSPYGCIDL